MKLQNCVWTYFITIFFMGFYSCWRLFFFFCGNISCSGFLICIACVSTNAIPTVYFVCKCVRGNLLFSYVWMFWVFNAPICLVSDKHPVYNCETISIFNERANQYRVRCQQIKQILRQLPYWPNEQTFV